MNSLTDYLAHWSQTDPRRSLFTFVDVSGKEIDSCTYEDFHQQTNFLAARLQETKGVRQGHTVLLSYPPGLDMIKAFIACVKLGAIPVPVPPVSQFSFKKDVAPLNSVLMDADAELVLTDQKHKDIFHAHISKESTRPDSPGPLTSKAVTWAATDTISGKLDNFETHEQDLLFLQYTSGSTHTPRGVMVTHQNVLHNCRDMYLQRPVGVCWLPHYHDMGLIGYFLFVIITGGSSHWFSAMDFMRRPALWLETITKTRASNTSAPNFAFEYCLRQDKLPDTALVTLDLSSLNDLMNASESVHCDTVLRFWRRFQSCGLSRKALNVAYGLAEHTLRVSAGGRVHLAVNKDRLACQQPFIISGQHTLANAVQLPSAGRTLAGADVRIVDPESLQEKHEGSIGEIWIDSPSKATGYWGQPELSKQIFAARISHSDNVTEYLRTGDIGFFHEGELYVCGRRDDMVVIRGRNIFPTDIEATIESRFPEVEPGHVVAFGMSEQRSDEAQLVVFIESRNLNCAPDLNDVHLEIVNTHKVPVKTVAILRRGSIKRTTSGKIARHRCKSAFLQNRLEFLSVYRPECTNNTEKTVEEFLDELLKRVRSNAPETTTIAELGLDSLELVELGILLEKKTTQIIGTQSDLIYDLRLLQAATIGELRTIGGYLHPGQATATNIARQLEAGLQRLVNAEAKQMREDTSLNASYMPKPYIAPVSGTVTLLTGATGFLGSFLLEALLRLCDDPIVVLVRGQHHDHAKLRVSTALTKTPISPDVVSAAMRGRVQVLCADISQANLGLSQDQWATLTKSITTVFHCAAEVDYVKTYQDLRPANVTGTREVIRFCCSERTKELNFISTTFVCGWLGQKLESFRNTDMRGLDFGYAQSKWVAEQLVYEAEKRGLKTRVFRPAFITASESGHFSRSDIVTRVLGYMIRHELSFDSENQVSFLPAEICANNIVAISLLDDTQNTTFHLTASKYYSMATVSRLINALFAYEFSYTDTDGFIDYMKQNCNSDDDLFPLLAFFENSREKFKSMSHLRYDNRFYKTCCELSELSKPEPELEKTVNWIVSYLTSNGLIEAPLHPPDYSLRGQDEQIQRFTLSTI